MRLSQATALAVAFVCVGRPAMAEEAPTATPPLITGAIDVLSVGWPLGIGPGMAVAVGPVELGLRARLGDPVWAHLALRYYPIKLPWRPFFGVSVFAGRKLLTGGFEDPSIRGLAAEAGVEWPLDKDVSLAGAAGWSMNRTGRLGQELQIERFAGFFLDLWLRLHLPLKRSPAVAQPPR